MKTSWVTAALTTAFFSATPVTAEHHGSNFSLSTVKDNILMLTNKGGNIAISKGVDGLLIIDNGYSDQSQELAATLQKVSGASELQYIINTHWHGDHSGSNELLGNIATIVAHDNVRKRLSAPQSIPLFGMESKPYAKQGLPSLTYPDSINIHFNNDKLTLKHYPNGHTDSDTVVFFEKANIVHMGDHLFYPMFPFIDVSNQGNAVNYAANVKAVLEQINDKTVVIPGHGPVTNKEGLNNFLAMLEGTTAEVKAMKSAGKTLEQAQQAGLSDRWKKWGDGFIKEPTWIEIIYTSL